MNTRHLPRPHDDASDDAGLAMIIVILVSTVIVLLSAVSVQLSMHSLTGVSDDRNRVQGVHAAEAGVDLAFQRLQTTLPCSFAATLATGPETSSYAVRVDYYAGFPPTGNPLICVPGVGPSSTPQAAFIHSDGNVTPSNNGVRTMESLVQLTAVPGGAFDMAIFGDEGFDASNNVDVYGNAGNNAGVYTNGDAKCRNNEHLRGSLYAQGAITMSNNCSIDVDVWGKGNVAASNNASVVHDMKSSTGNISLNNNASVGHDAIAHGTNSGGSVGGQRVSGATLSDPPVETFPVVNFDSGAWATAGFTNQLNDGTDCTKAKSDIAAMSTASVKTVIVSSCAGGLSWSNNTTISVKQDLAIFSTNGFATANNFTLRSTDSTVHKVYWIVPYNAAARPCTTGHNIDENNNTTFDATIVLFRYTPCRYNVSNNNSGSGQIYGGSVQINNNFTLTFTPVDVPGATGGGGQGGYSVSIVYIRES